MIHRIFQLANVLYFALFLAVSCVFPEILSEIRQARASGQIASAVFEMECQEGALEKTAVPASGSTLYRLAEHLSQLGVQNWHKHGFRGQGLKIAVLDSGFRGYRNYLGKALPSGIQCRSFRFDGNLEAKDSQHGILCAEVVHQIAPGAELLFANWEPDDPGQFLNAVRWARDQGARIVSCSVIMPSWSDGDGGGITNETLNRLVGDGSDAKDLLFFACAGNTALRHWSGDFHPNASSFHEWEPGHDVNSLFPWGSDTVSVELYGLARSQYRLEVVDPKTGKDVNQKELAPPTEQGFNVVRFDPRAGTSYQLKVSSTLRKPASFHLVVLGGALNYATFQGSIPFPADCPRVLTVGAVSVDGQRLAYSSCGPNSVALKPDLVAPVPFPSKLRNNPFSGTSAAAPQAAGLAALCWSRHPDWKPNQVRKTLQESARDLGPPGHDWETGYGQIRLLNQDRLVMPRLLPFLGLP